MVKREEEDVKRSDCGSGWLWFCFTDHKGKRLSRQRPCVLFLFFFPIVMTQDERELDSCERGTLLENETSSRGESNLLCSIGRYCMVHALVPERAIFFISLC